MGMRYSAQDIYNLYLPTGQNKDIVCLVDFLAPPLIH